MNRSLSLVLIAVLLVPFMPAEVYARNGGNGGNGGNGRDGNRG